MVRTHDSVKSVFSVLSVRADVLVVPDPVELHVDGDVKSVDELAEELKDLSVSSGNQKSAQIDGTSGKDTTVKASAEAIARLKLHSSGKNVIAQVSVVSEEKNVAEDQVPRISSWLGISAKGFDNMVACGLKKLCSDLDDLSATSLEDIRYFRRQLKTLEAETEKYQEESRSKPYTGSKSFVVYSNFYAQDTLAFLLDWMDFKQPEYATTTDVDGMYIGVVYLLIPATHSITVGGRIGLRAYCPMPSLIEANNSAAREAIIYLENEFKLQVVDYHFSGIPGLEQELSFLRDLKKRVLLLGATIQEFWKKNLDSFSSVVNMSKEDAKVKTSRGHLADKVDFINKCITHLEGTEKRMSRMFGILVEKLNDLTPVVYDRL